MSKLKHLWSGLRASFWFMPSVIISVSIVLAVALIEIDSSGGMAWMERWPRLFGAGAEGARGMLSTIAGSMMTVVGVTFSMTLVTLALAASQYTSRILRNFMRDRMTQAVLGIFAGIFTYCLIVLRTIRSAEDTAFIPSLAVSFAVVLAIGGVGILVYFIHHIASSIQASNVIASVATETMAAIDRLFPEKLGEGHGDGDESVSSVPMPERDWRAFPAPRDGYIQGVDSEALLRLARTRRAVVRMERGIGEFVVRDTALASLALEAAPDPEIAVELQSAYAIGRHRTIEQDAAFGIRQIVDMALRALSPGINDTTTATMCVDYLAAILARLASRPIPSPLRYENGELRLIATGPTFESLAAQSFDQIRGSAAGNFAMLLHMLGAIETIASRTGSESRRKVLQDNMERLAEVASRTLEASWDRARWENRVACVREALQAG